MQLRAECCPSAQIALSNRVAVNPDDFAGVPDTAHVLMDGIIAYQIVKVGEVAPGTIGLAGNMRAWGIWNVQQLVTVEPYIITNPNLFSLDLAISFRRKSVIQTNPIVLEQLVVHFKRIFLDQVLQPTAPVVVGYNSAIFTITVLSVLLETVDEERVLTDISCKGTLIESTRVNFHPANNIIFAT